MNQNPSWPPGRLFIGIIISAALLFIGTGRLPETWAQEKKAPKPAADTLAPTVWTVEAAQTVIRELNPQYDGNGQFYIKDGQVTAARLAGTGIVDLTPLNGMNLFALDIRGLAVTDLSPLKGQPLRKLYLEDTQVTDLSPLNGAPIETLYLSRTGVEDLTPLTGMPLKTLNLLGIPATDLTALKDMPLEYLWLNETQVTDISPLAGCPLVSLTLHKTAVESLAPLSDIQIKRLHIGETPVTDLTPLKGLNLQRLIFTPGRVTTGLSIVRNMASIQEIGLSFDNRMPPATFWAKYDRGEFK